MPNKNPPTKTGVAGLIELMNILRSQDGCPWDLEQTHQSLIEYLIEEAYEYAENKIIADFKNYIDKTYGQHYMTEEQNIECFDVWLALGDSMPTFRNTAIKYLWRYGKKKGSNKDDLMKVLHYTLMMLYNDHYKDPK